MVESRRKIPTIPPAPIPMSKLADIKVWTPISIIVPTYNEAENIPHLLRRLGELRDTYSLDLEVIVMDDDSKDGTAQAVADFDADWARAIVRTEDRGLSPSVIDGMRAAKNPVFIVMDADLSHPPEVLPKMILALEAGHDFVIGSRYVKGGTTDDDWGLFRWLNSRVATLMSRPLTSAKDPMAGFFALRKSDFEKAKELSPVGYKIGLELIVKCNLDNIGEIPIHFSDRQYGESKLTLKEQLLFIQHLRRLFIFKFGVWSDAAQFLAVGASGVITNMAVLALLMMMGMNKYLAIYIAIYVSMFGNFLLNRRFTFGHSRHNGTFMKQCIGFMLACSVGAVVNGVTTSLLSNYIFHELEPTKSVLCATPFGIAAGMIFNWVVNRYFVFKVKHVRT